MFRKERVLLDFRDPEQKEKELLVDDNDPLAEEVFHIYNHTSQQGKVER